MIETFQKYEIYFDYSRNFFPRPSSLVLRPSSFVSGQCKDKHAAFAFFAFHPDLASMFFDEFLPDDQSQSGAGFPFGTGAVGILVEVEKVTELAFRYPWHQCKGFRLKAGDASLQTGPFQEVVEQIVEVGGRLRQDYGIFIKIIA